MNFHFSQILNKALEESKPITIFCGAGTSRLIGCKGWDQLAHELLNKAVELKLINFRKQNDLTSINNSRKIITICEGVFKKGSQDAKFDECIRNALKPKVSLKHDEDKNIFKPLKKLVDQIENKGFFTVNLITTNYDNHLLDEFPKRAKEFSSVEDMNSDFFEKIDSTKVFYMHGHVDNQQSLIVTVSDYLKLYAKSDFKEHMKKLFEKSLILFLGYSLNEFELLSMTIDPNNTTALSHYTLEGYFDVNGSEFTELDKYYFHGLGIDPIPYEKTHKSYHQQIDLLKEWIQQVEDWKPDLYEKFRETESLAKEILEGDLL
ncbi:MAG: SIR2 family protein [Candidatus Caenarcaniphilales bacterium]|nr:SIR2 family protein [Candidatus Caenarcaniphilales bacterium]